MRRLWRWLRWVLLVVGLLIGGWLIWTAILRNRFETRLEVLREAGELVDPEDLQEPLLPAGVNAAPLLRKAAELIGDVPETMWDPNADYLTEEELADAREWVASKAEAIDLLHQAAAMPGYRVPIDWAQGPEAQMLAIPWTIRATRMLQAYARSMARDGRAAEALRCVETMFRLGDHLPRATVIAYQVRLTVHASAIETLEEIARADGFDPAVAQERLRPFLGDGCVDLDRALVAFGSERVMMLWVIDRWIDGESPRRLLEMFNILGRLLEKKPKPAPLVDWFLSSWITRPFAYKDGLLLLDDVERRMGQLKSMDLDALIEESDAAGAPYFFSTIFRPVGPHLGVSMRRHLAIIRVARSGLVALLARQRTGRFPRDLALPLDPFTKDKKPLRYVIRNDGSARVEARAPVPAPFRDKPDFRKDYEIVWELK